MQFYMIADLLHLGVACFLAVKGKVDCRSGFVYELHLFVSSVALEVVHTLD